jgi:hypothetical protein
MGAAADSGRISAQGRKKRISSKIKTNFGVAKRRRRCTMNTVKHQKGFAIGVKPASGAPNMALSAHRRAFQNLDLLPKPTTMENSQ